MTSHEPSPPARPRAGGLPLFLRAAWGYDTERAPVWLMRQAGRYLPEYRALKERYTFWKLASDPELAAEVTLQPVRRYAVDAAVIFTDIMVPACSMGVPVEFTPGPVIAPLRGERDIKELHVPGPDEVAPFLGEAIRLTAAETEVPVIGHAGAPLTFAAYLVTGKKSPDHVEFRGWLREHPALAHLLLEKAATVAVNSLRMQVAAGARAVQLFDSWAGIHGVADYAEFGLPYARRVLEECADLGVPRVYYAAGSPHLYPAMARLPREVAGVDWRTPLGDSRKALGAAALQGNLDPATLLSGERAVRDAVRRVLTEGLGGPHIFNVGGGVLPGTPVDAVAHLVDEVREFARTPAGTAAEVAAGAPGA